MFLTIRFHLLNARYLVSPYNFSLSLITFTIFYNCITFEKRINN